MNEIELDYSLAELPSPQHRAGLAGLVLMVKELHQHPDFFGGEGVLIKFKELEPYQATLQLNLAGLKALFDFTYQAFEERRWTTDKKVKKYQEIREVEVADKKTGKTKQVKQYGYDVIVPIGAFLPNYEPSCDDPKEKIWLKLWRDMLWNIIRAVPTTRNPFNLRVNGQSYSKDAEKIWKELQTPEKVTGQTGQYFLGAMASNAENVPTKERVKYQFLLHFWPFVTQVYCPAILNKDGKREISGYVLAIPDVANLQNFCRVFPQVLTGRESKLWRYLPREAVIDLPQEGALDLLRLLRDRIAKEMGEQSIRRTILGVEVIHAERVGKSGVKIRSISYVKPILEQIDPYEDIIKHYWCPWFRKQRLLNLINSFQDSDKSDEFDRPDEPYPKLPGWIEFDALLSRIPRKWLEDPYFSHDARQLFEYEVKVKMKPEIRDDAQIVYQVCQSYVFSTLETKYNMKFDQNTKNPIDVKSKKSIPQKDFDDKKYKYDAVFHQSPLNAKTKNNEKNYWSNASTSVLLHREVTHTAFQYPFALSQRDCLEKPEWVKALLNAIAQLNEVGGGHARAYYEFAPRSVVARLTPKLVAGYDTYGFNDSGEFPELIERLLNADQETGYLLGQEFWFGGEIVRNFDGETKTRLDEMGVNLYANPEQLFERLANQFLGE